MLWNRNYFLRFPGSDFWKVTVPVPAPTFDKLRFRFRFRFHRYLDHENQIVQQICWKKLAFLQLFYKETIFKFHQIYCKMWMKKILNEWNQILNFISSSGSETLINYFLTSYGSGSSSQKVTVSKVPVPNPQYLLIQNEMKSFSSLIENSLDLAQMNFLMVACQLARLYSGATSVSVRGQGGANV